MYSFKYKQDNFCLILYLIVSNKLFFENFKFYYIRIDFFSNLKKFRNTCVELFTYLFFIFLSCKMFLFYLSLNHTLEYLYANFRILLFYFHFHAEITKIF